MKIVFRSCVLGFTAIAILGLPCPMLGAAPTADQALKLTPVQAGVDCDRPTPEEAAKCKIKLLDGHKGWIVEGPDGVILRKFVDTNGDNKVDQWSYYKDGLEVYRDIDSNFNGTSDQFRWFHTAGSRWGIDTNEDGVIDSWKAISAEEVTAEVVAAIAAQDVDRFARLVLTAEELKQLGLGTARANSVAEKTAKVVGGFKAMASQQKTVAANSNWVQFSAGRPGVVPAGTDDATKDLQVYENVTAIMETGGKHGQVQIGTLVQVGDGWRLIDLPQPVVEGQADTSPAGYFFQPATARRGEQSAAAGATDAYQKLFADLDALDRDAAKATTAEEQIGFMTKRTDLLGQLADSARGPEDRGMWLRQLADTVFSGVLSGTCPDGAERLNALVDKLQKSDTDKELVAYVKFRQLAVARDTALRTPKADWPKVQAEWLKNLEQYVTDYPTAPDTAEAMLQLGSAMEFAGQDDDAKKWYGRAVKEFPASLAGKKAGGAQIRLDSTGKVIALSGTSPSGGSVDLAKNVGKVVLIQYWATWSEPAKADMARLKELVNKYGKSFTVIGVSLDSSAADLKAYLAENPLPWPQIYEEGGLDSRPANALGILMVPTMILVDQQGKVVDRNIAVADLEPELKKLIQK